MLLLNSDYTCGTLEKLRRALKNFRYDSKQFGVWHVELSHSDKIYKVKTSDINDYLTSDFSIKLFEENLKQLNLYFEKEVKEKFGNCVRKQSEEKPIKTTYTYTITARRYKLLELRAPHPSIEFIKTTPTDFSIISSTKKNYPIHSFILKGWNVDYFEVALGDNFKKQNHLQLNYNDKIISILVDYLYSLEQGVLIRHPKLNLGKWSELLNLGDFLGFEALVNFCAYEIAQNFSPTEARDTLVLYLANNINNPYYNEVYNNIGTETEKEYTLRIMKEKLIKVFPFLEKEQSKIQVYNDIVYFHIVGDFKLTFILQRKIGNIYFIYIMVNDRSIFNMRSKKYFSAFSKHMDKNKIRYDHYNNPNFLDSNVSIPLSQEIGNPILELYNGILNDPIIIKNLTEKMNSLNSDIEKYEVLLSKIKNDIAKEKDKDEVLKYKYQIKGIKKHLDNAKVSRHVLKDFYYDKSFESYEEVSVSRLYRIKMREAQLRIDLDIGSKYEENKEYNNYDRMLKQRNVRKNKSRSPYDNNSSSDSDIDRAIIKIRRRENPNEEILSYSDEEPLEERKGKGPGSSSNESEESDDLSDDVPYAPKRVKENYFKDSDEESDEESNYSSDDAPPRPKRKGKEPDSSTDESSDDAPPSPKRKGKYFEDSDEESSDEEKLKRNRPSLNSSDEDED